MRAGTAEILGVRREVIEHFSRRRQAILQELDRRGLHSARAAQVATLDTRPVKGPSRSTTRLREQWRSRAAELGLDRETLRALLDREQPAVGIPIVDIEQLTAHESTFGRPELVETAAVAFSAGASFREVEALTDELGARSEVVAVGRRAARPGLVEPRFSTQELLEAERSLMRAADERKRRARTVTPADRVDQALAAAPALGEDQQAMVRQLCVSPSPVQVVRAPAGTGKTFALGVARAAWRASDVPVLGCALSARAAEELAKLPSVARAERFSPIGRRTRAASRAGLAAALGVANLDARVPRPLRRHSRPLRSRWSSSPWAAVGVERAHRVLLEPALELANRDQTPAPATHYAQLVHDVDFEEVDADPQGFGRLALGER